MNLTPLDWSILAIYCIGLSALGFVVGKSQASRKDYQLGGGNIHWLLAGGSLLATLLSTMTFVAVPGEVVRYGPMLFIWILALPFAVAVVGSLLIPIFKALPYTSVYEYLEHRFSARMRTLAAGVFVIRTVIWMGLIIYACCLVVTAVTGWSLTATIIGLGAITTVYATVGGFRTVVYTDNVQLVILLGGALVIPWTVFRAIGSGPVEWWGAMAQAGHADIPIFSLDPTLRVTILGAILSKFFWTICTHASDQTAVQRYLSTSSLSAARRTLWTAVLLEATMVALLVLCGSALFGYYQYQSGLGPEAFLRTAATTADTLLPQFIATELPSGVSGLLIAALLAAAMSSLSSGVSSVSAVFVEDFRGMFSEGASRGSLRLDRLVALLAGLAGIGVALAIAPAAQQTSWNLVDLLMRLNHIFVAPLAVVFFVGILMPKAGMAAALSGSAAALLCSLFICTPGAWWGIDGDVSFMWIVPAPFLIGMGVSLMVGFASPRAQLSSRSSHCAGNEGASRNRITR